MYICMYGPKVSDFCWNLLCVCMYECMRVCMYVCMHARMYGPLIPDFQWKPAACMHVCICMCMYVSLNV